MTLSLYIGSSDLSGDVGPTYTFTSRNIGTAATNRTVYVCVGTRRTAGGKIQSVTIGGISATECVSQLSNGSANDNGIWCATVPTGTTATVVVTTAGNSGQHCSIQCYSVTGDHTLHATAKGVNGPISKTITAKSGGYLIGTGCGSNAAPSATWTGITEDLDTTTSTQSDTFSTASISISSDSTVTVTFDTTGADYVDGLAVVSLAPTASTIPPRRQSTQASIRSTF